MISVPGGSESLLKPSRNREFGLPPSIIQFTTFPSAPLTSMRIQECGFTNSHLVTVPRSFSVFSTSNSAAKAWWGSAGTAVRIKLVLIAAIDNIFRIGFVSYSSFSLRVLLGGFRGQLFLLPSLGEIVDHV